MTIGWCTSLTQEVSQVLEVASNSCLWSFYLVFHFDLELSGRYQVEYINSSGESIVPYQSGLMIQETLLQCVATIASACIYNPNGRQ